jgi:hypothetical protein
MRRASSRWSRSSDLALLKRPFVKEWNTAVPLADGPNEGKGNVSFGTYMARRRANTTARARPEAAEPALYRAGYSCLVLLALALPFEFTQRPLFSTTYLTLTNLKLVQYVVVALALATLVRERRARPMGGYWLGNRRRAGMHAGASRQGAMLFLALVLACLLSSLVARERTAGLKWTLDLALAGILWLVAPLWLARDTEGRLNRIAVALVAGATLSALVGFMEFALGMRFADSLTLFKAKPSLAGAYLRLSATFEYTNIAAMYFELVLPFAVAGALRALAAPRRNPLRIALWVVCSAVLLEAVLLTYSRGALLGLALGLFAMALLARDRLRLPHGGRWIAALAVGLGLIMVIITLSAGPLSALRLNTQSDQEWYRVAFYSAPPATLNVCQRRAIPVTVVNRSPLTWQVEGSQRTRLSYHWLYPSQRMAVFEGIRTTLRGDLPPGGRQTLIAQVQAPSTPGRYLLVWDMVQEDVSWFSLKSASYHGVPVRVEKPAGRDPCAVTPPVVSHAPSPSSLPTTLQEPPRQQLWRAALAIFVAHPLLGIGPDGYRLSYGLYLQPPRRQWDQRILANSLYLELLADLGLIGAMLCAALLLAILRPFARTLRRRDLSPISLALCGAFVAFLGHGLLDYNLESHAIFLLFWLLCGMAAAAVMRQASNVSGYGRASGTSTPHVRAPSETGIADVGRH